MEVKKGTGSQKIQKKHTKRNLEILSTVINGLKISVNRHELTDWVEKKSEILLFVKL